MPEFYMKFAQKVNKIPEFYMIFDGKMPKFYMKIVPKIFSGFFWGCVRDSMSPMSYAYVLDPLWQLVGSILYPVRNNIIIHYYDDIQLSDPSLLACISTHVNAELFISFLWGKLWTNLTRSRTFQVNNMHVCSSVCVCVYCYCWGHLSNANHFLSDIKYNY